jgi:cytochrome b561
MKSAPLKVEVPTVYPAISRAFHWLTLVLVAAAFGLVWAVPEGPATPQGDFFNAWHRTIGIIVWLITLLRLSWRLHAGVPLPEGSLSPLERRASAAVHWLLYGFLIAQPMLGYLAANLWKSQTMLFNAVTMPALVSGSESLKQPVEDIHIYAGYTLLALIGGHSAAALYHHFWRRDGVLRRMLPWRSHGETV